MTQKSTRPNKPKNTRRKKNPYETRIRTRFDVQAEVVTSPRIATRVYRTTDAQVHIVVKCRIGHEAVGQFCTVRFVGTNTVEMAAELIPGDRLILRDDFFWGPERTAGHQEIHAPRFEYVPSDPEHPNAWKFHGSLLEAE